MSFDARSKDHAKTFPGSDNPSRGTALEAKVPLKIIVLIQYSGPY